MPSGIPVSSLSPQMRERYEVGRTSWWTYTGIGAVVAAFAAALVFVGWQLASPQVDYRVLTWSVVAPDRTDITFEVRRAAEADVYCVLRAQDSTWADVGYAIAVVPRGTSYAQQTYSLRTLAPAYGIEVLGCAVGAPPDRVPPPQFPPGVVPPEQPWTSGRP